MSLIVDFLLLAASGAACFYCWFLNQRLKALTGAKDGLQTGVAALSQSAEDMQTALAEAKATASESAARLEALIAEADKRSPELEDILSQLSTIAARTVDETEAASKGLVDTLAPHIRDARVSAQLLLTALEETERRAPDISRAAQEEAQSDETPASADADGGSTSLDDDEIAFIDGDEKAQGEAA